MLNFKSRKNLDSYFSGQETKKKIDKKKILKIAAIIIAAVLVLLLAWGLLSFANNYAAHSKANVAVRNNDTQPDTQSAAGRAAKHLLLPEEKPVVIEIKNSADLIKEQAFYAGAQDGDILLIYAAAKKAVIYSPARDIIINVGPIYAGQDIKTIK